MIGYQQRQDHTILAELAHYEGMNVLKDYFGLLYTGRQAA